MQADQGEEQRGIAEEEPAGFAAQVAHFGNRHWEQQLFLHRNLADR